MFIEYYSTCYIMITIQTMDLHTALVSHLDEASEERVKNCELIMG